MRDWGFEQGAAAAYLVVAATIVSATIVVVALTA